MKPIRNFQFRNKKQIFACVGFRYDQPQSMDYRQFKDPESVRGMVFRLLTQEDGADVISIRRVYLAQDEQVEGEDPQSKLGEKTYTMLDAVI